MKFENISLSYFRDHRFLAFGSPLPNGVYKGYMKLYNDDDYNIGTVTLFVEINVHFQKMDFK